LLIAAVLLCAVAAKRRAVLPPAARQPLADAFSAANPHDVESTHLALDLTVDFGAQQLRGSVTHTLLHHGAARQFIVDTNGLDVDAVTADGAVTPWSFGATNANGTPLVVDVTPETQTVRIDYRTRSTAGDVERERARPGAHVDSAAGHAVDARDVRRHHPRPRRRDGADERREQPDRGDRHRRLHLLDAALDPVVPDRADGRGLRVPYLATKPTTHLTVLHRTFTGNERPLFNIIPYQKGAELLATRSPTEPTYSSTTGSTAAVCRPTRRRSRCRRSPRA
jgi:hypothetical protein